MSREAIQARLSAITRGRWVVILPGDESWTDRDRYRCVAFGGKDADYTTAPLVPADAEFIARAPRDIAALLSCATALAFHNQTPSGQVRKCLPECLACAALAGL